MNKTVKTILCIISVIAAIAAAAFVVIRYKDEMCAFFEKIKDKFSRKSRFTNEEYEDFADI